MAASCSSSERRPKLMVPTCTTLDIEPSLRISKLLVILKISVYFCVDEEISDIA